jgi:hypothetical protein
MDRRENAEKDHSCKRQAGESGSIADYE